MKWRWAAMVMTVLLAVSGCSPEEPAEEAITPGPLVVTGVDGSVTLVEADGGEGQVLREAAEPGVPVQATPSHDGRVVVWSQVNDGAASVSVSRGGEVERVEAATAPFFYMFSPDDSRVAALGNAPDGGGVALIMIELSEPSATVVDVGQPYYVSWNPNSAELVAHIGLDTLSRVALDGARTDLAASPGVFQAPQWLPDGRIVAVVTVEGVTVGLGTQSGHSSLVVIDPEDGEAVPLADVATPVMFEAASGGERVAFVDGEDGSMLGGLEVVDVTGGEPVTVAGEDVVALEWSPDGQALLYHTLEEGEGLVPHVWEGETVVDYAGFLPTPLFLTQYLPFWAQYVQTITQWASDGSAFAYAAASDDGPGQIWVQPVDGERHQVTEGEMVVWSP